MKHIKSFDTNKGISNTFLNASFGDINIQFLGDRKGKQLTFYGSIKEPNLSSKLYDDESYEDYLIEIENLNNFHKKIKDGIQNVIDEYNCECSIEIEQKWRNALKLETEKIITIKFIRDI